MSNQRLPLWTPPLPLFLWHLPPPWDRPQCGGGSHWGTIWEPAVSQISKPRYPPVILQGSSKDHPGIIEVSHRRPTETHLQTVFCINSSSDLQLGCSSSKWVGEPDVTRLLHDRRLSFELSLSIFLLLCDGFLFVENCPSSLWLFFICGKLSFFFVENKQHSGFLFVEN